MYLSMCAHAARTHTHTHTQISSPDDPLGILLKELPEPTEDALKNVQSVVKLDLIQTRENLGLSEDLIGGRVCLIQCIQGCGRNLGTQSSALRDTKCCTVQNYLQQADIRADVFSLMSGQSSMMSEHL